MPINDDLFKVDNVEVGHPILRAKGYIRVYTEYERRVIPGPFSPNFHRGGKVRWIRGFICKIWDLKWLLKYLLFTTSRFFSIF